MHENGENENPKRKGERLEHIAESLERFHDVHKTESEIIDQLLVAAEENEVLVDVAKCIRRERNREADMNPTLVKNVSEQDFKADRRCKKVRRKKRRNRRRSSSSDSSSSDEKEEHRLEEQALMTESPDAAFAEAFESWLEARISAESIFPTNLEQ